MLASSVPLLVIRTDSPALVEVNGQMLGECSPEGYVAMPAAETGDYYVFLQPLSPLCYGVTRKFSLQDGRLLAMSAEDVSLCSWPGGVYVLFIQCGRFPGNLRPRFPRILEQGNFLDYSCVLYTEELIRLDLEREGELLMSFCLGEGESGSLRHFQDCLAVEVYKEKRTRLFLFDPSLALLLDIEGDTILFEEEGIAAIDRLSTCRGHEKKRLYKREKEGLLPPVESIGFFTHPPKPLEGELSLALAFFEAVREGFSEEAADYLTEELKEGADLASIRAFLGDYQKAEAPLSDNSGRLMGLIREEQPRFHSARLYRLSFRAGKIDNIAEL